MSIQTITIPRYVFKKREVAMLMSRMLDVISETGSTPEEIQALNELRKLLAWHEGIFTAMPDGTIKPEANAGRLLRLVKP